MTIVIDVIAAVIGAVGIVLMGVAVYRVYKWERPK
jgi:hypothetical protein